MAFFPNPQIVRILAVTLWFVASQLSSQDISKLPEWARAHVAAAAQEPTPADADAWVLLDRMEIAYLGRGEIGVQRFRLVRVITEKALDESVYVLDGLGGKASRVKNLRGWNLRPDGEIERISRGDASVEANGYSTLTGVSLSRVSRGSLVAWQSMQVFQSPVGPVSEVYPLGRHPVRRWEMELGKREGWFADLKQVKVQLELRGFTPWISSPDVVANQSVRLSNLPALPLEEGASLHPRNFLPRVVTRFLDPDLKTAPCLEQGWNGLASWYASRYQGGISSFSAPIGGAPRERLQSIHRFMREHLTYKQFYLSAERGWIPEDPAEVGRKRYGDCKDLTMYFIASARAEGLHAFPALCRIVDGTLDEDEPVSPYAFNHVIAAVKLDASLGLASEVETQQGRFLLVDLTERYQLLGKIGEAHMGQRIMICTEGGAIWVQVPDQAIGHPEIQVRLKGDVNYFGRLKCTLTVQETGNALGLRNECQESGPKAIKDYLLRSLLNLPLDAVVEVVSQGNPMDVSRPFETIFSVDMPNAFKIQGREGTIPGFLFPAVPRQIQQMGKPRRFPVGSSRGPLMRYEAELKMGVIVQPVLANLQFNTPLRQLVWSVRAEPMEGGRSLVCWTLTNQQKAARFMIPGQDSGVQAWKQDRIAMQKLFADGLAFKVPVSLP